MLSRISSKGIYKHISSNCVCPVSVLSLYLLLCICTCSLEKIKKKSWYCVFIIVIVLYFCCICMCNEILFNKWNVRQHSHPVGWKDAAVSGTCVTKTISARLTCSFSRPRTIHHPKKTSSLTRTSAKNIFQTTKVFPKWWLNVQNFTKFHLLLIFLDWGQGIS